ncbi:MAG: 3-hydroxyacyl-ACP dehydratase [Niabella sp.]
MTITDDILSFIPQRAPFVMIDALVHCDDAGAVTSFEVREGNIFLEDGILKEPALVENMAQTAAARVGYICQKEGKPVPVGFIGAIQHLKVHGLPQTGDVLHTTITIKNQIFNATIIEGVVRSGGKILATGEMRIFVSS